MAKISFLDVLKDQSSYFFYLKNILKENINNLFNINISTDEIILKFNDKKNLGDLSTNVSFILASKLKKSPIEISNNIVSSLNTQNINYVNGIESIAGFINIYLDQEIYFNNLFEILYLNDKYGFWDVAKGSVMVEFGQPNTHKAMTAGHIKSAVTGLAICNLLHVLGYEVIKINYYSDIGLNVAKCTWAFLRKGKPYNFDNLSIQAQMEYVADCYVYGHNKYKNDPQAAIEIKNINKAIYNKSDTVILEVYEYLKNISLKSQTEIFSKLGINYDRQYSESETIEIAKKIVLANLNKVFIKDDGAIIFPGEKYGLDRWVFLTNQDLPTYSAKDLGLSFLKFNEYSNLHFSIVLTSTEQTNYFVAIIKALELIKPELAKKYFHLGFGWLLKDNKKMSSKLGNVVSVRNLFIDAFNFAKTKISENKTYSEEEIDYIAEKVFLAGLKFLFLSRELHIDINYDPKQFLDPQGFSGPYVLYAYVRAKSILKNILPDFNFDVNKQNFNKLTPSDLEFELIKYLYQYPFITFDAAKNLSPHLIANYLFNLSKVFNKFYKNHEVLSEKNPLIKELRLLLTYAFTIVCKNGLNLLGIETVKKM